jgi:hypothetical protein
MTDPYDHSILFLRNLDKGADGPFEKAAECIEVLLGENYQLKEQLSCFKETETPSDVAIRQHEGAARHWAKRWK